MFVLISIIFSLLSKLANKLTELCSLLCHSFMTHISGLLAEVNDDTTGNPIVTADAQIANSNLCFETLMHLYYLRHSFEGCDAYLTHNLAVLAFTTLNSLKSAVSSLSTTEIEDIRGTLILTAKDLDGQGENYHLTRTIFHILRADMMPKDESITTRTTSVRLEDELDTDLRMEYIQAQYPINITNIAESPDNMRLSNIIKKNMELNSSCCDTVVCISFSWQEIA